MRYLKSAIAIMLLGLIASPVWADEEPPQERPRDGEQRQRMIEKFDTDGDGKLNEEERHAAREARQRAGRPRGDARRGERPRDERPRDGDRLGEGRGRAERERGEARRGPERPEGPQGGPRRMMDPERMFDRLDANGDGEISRQEFKEGMEKMRAGGPPEGRRGGDRDRRGRGGPDGARARRGGPEEGPPREGRRPDRPPRAERDDNDDN